MSDIPLWAESMDDVPVMPLFLQRRWARISRQYMRVYLQGADACEAIELVRGMRTNGRHRDTSDASDTSDARMKKTEAKMAEAANSM